MGKVHSGVFKVTAAVYISMVLLVVYRHVYYVPTLLFRLASDVENHDK
jgi:hypothetical protein